MVLAKVESDYGILTRKEFLDEFDYRYTAGQHVVLFGPTGRGKTTLAGQMLPKAAAKHDGALTIQLGRDPALEKFGKPTNNWPPRIPLPLLLYDERPYIRRYQPLPKKPEHFRIIRRQASSILRWMFGRRNWQLFIPDLQVVTDPGMMGLYKELDQLLLTLRKLNSSIWMDAQAPRWIPTSASDQTSHLLIWRNRNENTMKRLKEIAGIDFKLMVDILTNINYHDALWIDVKNDEYFVVLSK